MSFEDENDYWTESDVRAFSFDDDEQSNVVADSTKTLESILAAKPASNEPFLKPSMIMCPQDGIERLLEYLESRKVQPIKNSIRPDPRTCIIEILDGKRTMDFSIFKTRREKLMLLDCAISSLDGNVITAVTIFISKTLKLSLFADELKSRPIALDHYLNYLNTLVEPRLDNLVKKFEGLRSSL